MLEDLLLKTQKELKGFLFEKMETYGYTVNSEDGYLKCEYPNVHPSLLIAHLDTYSNIPPEKIVAEDNVIVGYDKEDNRCVLGGDDRCGVYIILMLLENGYRPQVLFTEDEEIGCIGASQFIINDEQFPEKIDYCIQIDRGIKNQMGTPITNNYVDYNVSNEQLNGYIESLGFVKMTGTSSDVRHIAPYLKIPGVNVCAGYQYEHCADECICMDVVENTFNLLCKIFEI